MKIQLTEQQYDYLNNNLVDKEAFLKIINSNQIERNLFDLDEEFIEELREWCIETQIKTGFDNQYKLNNKGKILETLIDLLYR